MALWGSQYWGSQYWGAQYWGGVAAEAHGYWSSEYWNPNHWADNYWSSDAPAPSDGKYWADRYWNREHWHSRYWAGGPSLQPGQQGTYWRPTYWSGDYWGPEYWASIFEGGGESIGSLNVVLQDALAAFFGAASSPGSHSGPLSATLQGASGVLLGYSAAVTRFNISVAISPTFVTQEFPGFVGELETTLDDAASTVVGTFTAPGAVIGQIVSQLDAAAGEFLGAHTAPPFVLGALDTSTEGDSAVLLGSVFAPGSVVGQIDAVAGDDIAQFFGTYVPLNVTGVLQAQLDNALALLTGFTLGAGARLGTLVTTLDGATAEIIGVSEESVVAREMFDARREQLRFDARREPTRYEVN